MGNLMELRSLYKDQFEKTHGVKLGFMSAFVAASAQALKEVPAVNAGFIHIKDSYNFIISYLCTLKLLMIIQMKLYTEITVISV